MSPAPHPVVERHAHFDDDNNEKNESTNKESFGKKSKKTPTSQTVFLDDDSNSEAAAGGEEKKEVTSRTEADHDGDDDDDDDSDSGDDEDARLKSHAFQRHHANKNSASPHPKGSGRGSGGLKVKRFDEYSDFLSRSERSRRDKKKGLKEESKAGGRVNWHPEEKASVQVLPELTDADASGMYLTRDVWERIDLDLELTMKRWDNHVSGRIAFDFLNNTIRGMEAMIDEEGSRWRDSVGRRRVRSVLEEQNRQRIAKEFYHAAKMRAVAAPTSLQDEATRRGQADAEEAVNIWLGTSSESHRPIGGAAATTTAPTKGKPPRGAGDKKKKSGSGGGFNLFGMFQGKHKK